MDNLDAAIETLRAAAAAAREAAQAAQTYSDQLSAAGQAAESWSL